jgi:hypothetical protein
MKKNLVLLILISIVASTFQACAQRGAQQVSSSDYNRQSPSYRKSSDSNRNSNINKNYYKSTTTTEIIDNREQSREYASEQYITPSPQTVYVQKAQPVVYVEQKPQTVYVQSTSCSSTPVYYSNQASYDDGEVVSTSYYYENPSVNINCSGY